MGACDEYGDNDSEGVVIHAYLVYALGLLMATLPWAMSDGATRAGTDYRRIRIGVSILWTLSAPAFFLPDGIDGAYEGYLGLIAIGTVITLATLFIRRGSTLRRPPRAVRSPPRIPLASSLHG